MSLSPFELKALFLGMVEVKLVFLGPETIHASTFSTSFIDTEYSFT